jgi:hypothetical protein
MGNYRTLYTIRIEHEYFEGNICRALQCRISPSGEELWRRRGLLFRRLNTNEWTILYDDASAGVDTHSDVLTLELDMIDPKFILYTRWEHFRPEAAYALQLPVAEETLEAEKGFIEEAPKRSIKSSFCMIRLKLTEELFLAAKSAEPKRCLLKFRPPEYKWEYLFIPHNEKQLSPENMHLEEINEKLHFSPFKLVDEYGKKVFYTVSEESVAMREHYHFSLKLTSFNKKDKRTKQMLLKNVLLPNPGVYLTPEPDMLRQVCYF